jgi:uncharacterized protein YjiS (DUF1127 family)
MTTTIIHLRTPAARATWLALVAWWEGLRTTIRHRRSASRTRRALAALDARMLNDLAIDRSEIASYAADAADAERARVYRSVFRV